MVCLDIIIAYIVFCCPADLPGFLQSIKGCFELKNLSIRGNPITLEPKFKYVGHVISHVIIVCCLLEITY